MPHTEALTKALSERILILDGAMGTMIQRLGLQEKDFRGERFEEWTCDLKGNNDLLSLTQPEKIQRIHEEYLEVGADLIETNTFSSTSIAMADYQMESLVSELNEASARIARKAADKYSALTPDKPRFVAGAIGPTNRTASLSPEVNDPGFRSINFDQLRVAYLEQARALIIGGVDVLLVETVFDTLNAKAALFAIGELSDELDLDIPVMVSGTITDNSGRTLSGQTAEAFLISLSHVDLLSIGLNCALGAEQLTPYLETLARKSSFYISAYPNAGLPNAFGAYDQSPEQMAEQVELYAQKGLINIVGGCCGTTPEHIGKISQAVLGYEPRRILKD